VNFNQCTFIGDRSSPSVARTNVTMLGYGISHTLNTGDNQVIIGNGKVKGWGFGAAPTTSKAFVVGSVSTNGNGAYLTVGGTWTNTSSRSLKDSITKVDGADVLKKISLLNVERWKYKETSEYHIGPFAEQFFELFNTGIDNKHISTVDPSGVALIGIQQLTKLNAEQQKLIEAQQKEIDALKARLDKLENK